MAISSRITERITKNIMCRFSLMVIRIPFNNSESPVKLFNEQQSYHLVRKCHSGEGYFQRGFFIHFIGKAPWPSNHENKSLCLVDGLLFHPSGKFETIEFLSSF